jgi:hypothetical protein
MDFKKLVDRAKNICLSPKTEWDVISGEATPLQQIIIQYVLPLAAVAAICEFIGTSLVGVNAGFFGSYKVPIGWGLAHVVYNVVMAVVFVCVLGVIIDALAPSFGGQKNFAQASKVAAYSWTPAWIAAILTIIPMLGILALLGALYGLYVLYLGLPRLMKNPQEKALSYTVVVVISAIVLAVVVAVLGNLLVGGPGMMGGPGGRMGPG